MKSRRRKYLLAICVAAIVIAAIVTGVVLLTGDDEVAVAPIPGLEPSDDDRPVSEKVWPATLALHVELDAAQANQPADVAPLDGKMFVADTGHGRLVVVSPDGKISAELDQQDDPKLTLSGPMAVAAHEGQLYVADSDAGRVLVVAPSGAVGRVITLAKGSSADALPVRPIGIAVWNDGSFAVSDAANNRLNKYDSQGNLVWTVGTGERASVDNGFNGPSGLALDKNGNVYVVDVLNSKVKKYSPDGTFLYAFGQAGDRAGQFSRAKAVALDDAGNIYVSDGLGAAVQVFSETGSFLGFIGRKDPTDPKSVSLFEAPHGVEIVDGKLYVIDRFAGLFVFDLPNTTPATTQPDATQPAATQPSAND
jgi:sugar lactone lactonase YvrE